MSALAIIPTFIRTPDEVEVLADLLRSIQKTEPEVEVLLVDDCSPAPDLVRVVERLSSRFDFELIRKDVNSGFSSTVNVGLRRALEEDKDAVLLNADLEMISPGWLRLMQNQLDESDRPAAVVGALLIYPRPAGLIQHAGIFYSLLTRTVDHTYRYAPENLPEAQVARTCPVTGALQFIRHSTLEQIGIYDEGFRMGFEDVDYCLRVFEAGLSCIYQPSVRAWHFESMFRGRPSPKIAEWQQLSSMRLMRKWPELKAFAPWIPAVF